MGQRSRPPLVPSGDSPCVERSVPVVRPVTNGHLAFIFRASLLFDEVVVAVGVNTSKHRLFTVDERIAMLSEACRDTLQTVTVDSFNGLLTTFCQERDIIAIVKGLRAVSDFDYELQMAQMNSSLAEIETVFVPTSPEWSFLAFSLVTEIAHLRRRRLRPATRLRPERLVQRLDERRRDKEQ